MKSKKQKVILILKISSLIVLLGIVLLFAFRNDILNQVIHRIDTKMQRDYQCHFTIEKAEFSGLTHLEFHQIALVPIQADTLIQIKELKTSVNFWKLLVGDIQLGRLEINTGFVQLVKNKDGSNFDAFLRSKKEKEENPEVNYAQFLHRLSYKLLDLVPTDMQVKGFTFKINDNGNPITFDFNKLILADKKLNTLIQVSSDNFTQQWAIKGFADPRERKADLQFYNPKSDTIKIPYLDKKFNLKTGFQSIHFNLKKLSMSGGILSIDGSASIQNLVIHHKKIAHKEVIIKKARFDYRWMVGTRSIALDSSSTLQMNQIKCKPYVSYTNEQDKIYAFQLKIDKMKAQDFINSLPTGLFRHFEGMKAQGNFSYSLNFKYNNHQPNAIIFESKLRPEKLQITQYGEANLTKINQPFTYVAMENGRPQRAIVVGPENPYFTPLESISPYLQKCVLTSEDPSFFHHRGFINEAFKQSIVKNIKTKKFARGASTISMQLVKNVFLSREKTLSRKLEEIILVYILENQRIASKERMLDVYFNVIEFGPNVYGIGEASHYYFQKNPSELTLKECLFLASIIPKPKGFMYRFDENHQLKSFAREQSQFLTKVMLRRNLITELDTLGLSTPLELTGAAKSKLKAKENTVVTDSLELEEFEF